MLLEKQTQAEVREYVYINDLESINFQSVS